MQKMKILGIDLAWKSERNTTAIAVGELSGKEFRIVNIDKSLSNLEAVKNIINIDPSIYGISIDAPLIINNESGQRICETELSRVYSGRKAGCHTSNTRLYPNASSVELSNFYLENGFRHLGDYRREMWQIECYPHPAIVEIFDLPERLPYKKGKVSEKRKGQVILAGYIANLESSSVLKLTFDDLVVDILNRDIIESNRGHKIKESEDALDSIICAYIGALYATSVKHQIFGSVEKGYIYVPKQKCI